MPTFVEKIFKAPAGSIVFAAPEIVLTHDNTASIEKTFQKMGGEKVYDPDQLMVVLDHNAPPTTASVANNYSRIRDFVNEQGITKFYDAGDGICHQLMANHARPGMLIVGSDSHTCTAGAFNAMAAGIDRTESAGIWKRGETWFRVPDTIKITLLGKLQEGVYAKDLSLWIIGMLGSDGANYNSIEFHGEGVRNLTISDRMTLANLASEMGAKNAVFPSDEVLQSFLGVKEEGVWADPDARYCLELEIRISEVFPVVAVPHHVDNVKGIAEVAGTAIQQGLIGTCTSGRIEDLREAAEIIRGKTIKEGFQLLVIPASKAIYMQAVKEGLVSLFLEAGANVLSSSCGPCLGTGQGIPADGMKVLSTANRNFLGRMGNKNAEIYLASPAAVALAALHGEIVDPRGQNGKEKFPYQKEKPTTFLIDEKDDRKGKNVWNYTDVDNLNTDQMFAGHLTYKIQSSEPDEVKKHLFEDFDASFAARLDKDDIIIAGDNFGCGSSREHPAVGLAHAGVKAVIVKSVNRIFFRASINQGLPLIVLPEAVKAFKPGDTVSVDMEQGSVKIGTQDYHFEALPDKLIQILEKKGLVNYLIEGG
ncbi:homoaconitate hydratase family protein [Bacteroidota bacterium]